MPTSYARKEKISLPSSPPGLVCDLKEENKEAMVLEIKEAAVQRPPPTSRIGFNFTYPAQIFSLFILLFITYPVWNATTFCMFPAWCFVSNLFTVIV